MTGGRLSHNEGGRGRIERDIENFLDNGNPPVLESFGSILSDYLPQLWDWIRGALIDRRIRLTFVGPLFCLGETDNILSVPYVPFSE